MNFNTCKFLIGLLAIFILSNCATVGPGVRQSQKPPAKSTIEEEKPDVRLKEDRGEEIGGLETSIKGEEKVDVRLEEKRSQEIEENIEEYILGPDDEIEISVWRHDEADATATVDPNGKVSLPMVGEIQAEGLTRLQLERKVAQRLEKYHKNPSVRVVITEYNNRRVYVLGQVSEPGTQTLGGRPDLLGVISKAGGATEDANLRRCSVVRGKGKIVQVDLYELLVKGNLGLNIRIQPNDLIYVPDNTGNQVYVLGEVENAGLYSIKGEYTLIDAIMSAGGPTEDAELRRTQIVRGESEKPEIIIVQLGEALKGGDGSKNILLQPGDIVYVPNRFMAKVNYVLNQILPTLRTIVLYDSAESALAE